MYQEVYTFIFERKSHQSIGRGKSSYIFYHGCYVQNFINLVLRFTFYLGLCCFIFYDRGRVVLAAVSADSAGGVLGQSNTGGEPANYKCCNSLRKAAARNTEKRSEQKRKRTMLDQRPESVWPGVVCWPF